MCGALSRHEGAPTARRSGCIISTSARRSRRMPPRVWPWSHIRWPSLDRTVTSCGGGDAGDADHLADPVQQMQAVFRRVAGHPLRRRLARHRHGAKPRRRHSEADCARNGLTMPEHWHLRPHTAGGAGMTTALATRRRLLVPRQRQDRDQTRRRVGQSQAAAMQLRHRLHQRQPEPGARACCARSRRGRSARRRAPGPPPECPDPDRPPRSPRLPASLRPTAAPRRRAARISPRCPPGWPPPAGSVRGRRTPADARAPATASAMPFSSATAPYSSATSASSGARSSGAKAARREPASISAMRSSAWNTATMPSRSAVARSIAARSSPTVPACSAASSSLARARVIGVRRSCAMAFDTSRTPSISRAMRSSMSLIVSASWSNSSPRPDSLHALGEVAGRDRRGGGRDVGQRAAEQAAHHQRADRGHRQHHQQRPQQRVGQQRAQLRAHLHVAADQQAEAAGQVEALHDRQRAHAGALDRQFVPGAVLRRRLAASAPGCRRSAAPPDRPAGRSHRPRRSASAGPRW